MFVDTHSHIYCEEFSTDRDEVVIRARQSGIDCVVLPNIDSSSIKAMLDLTDSNPGYFRPLIGLHPTSVKEDYKKELEIIEYWLSKRKFYGIGEIGIDLYWDKTFQPEQTEVFKIQIGWAKQLKLPIVVHMRDSFTEVMEVLREKKDESLRGVFHSFGGTLEEARQIIELGFKLGIGGIVTFKKSGLDNVIPEIGLQNILLETDSPWLAPVPHRGRRNECSYLTSIASKVAELQKATVGEVAEVTSRNAMELFGL